PEPHRTGLRQAQAPVAQSRRAHLRRALRRNRPAPRSVQARRMRQLFPKRRICPNLNASRSSVRLPADRPGIPDAAPIKTAPALAGRAPARTNRVLVIDDDATVRDLMRRYLSRE